jgi:type VI secretion system protein ImpG
LEDLRHYYENELAYLRTLGAEFKRKYPKIADRLQLDDNIVSDPHAERILEGFAFLAARIHTRLDDDFPEIADALLSVVYPHFQRPTPSFSVVQLLPDPGQKLSTGAVIDRGSMVAARQAQGVVCRFRTCYETTIWPVEVASAEWTTAESLDPPVRGSGSTAVIRLVIRCQSEATLGKLGIDSLRFFLNGTGEHPFALYEMLLNNTTQVLARDPQSPRKPPYRFGREALRPVGFEPDDALLPYPKRSFEGYRLLQEYFAFPQKFLFFELHGLRQATAGFQDAVEILFFLSPFERADRREMLETRTVTGAFRLNCTPIVNLFSQTADPILLTHTRHEYAITPDSRRPKGIEVLSIDEVVSASPGSSEVQPYDPFYSCRHSSGDGKPRTFWYAKRRPLPWRTDGGTDMFISLVDLSGRPCVPEASALTCRLTCTNRDLPSRLPSGSESGDFELEGGGVVRRMTALIPPTPSYPAPSEGAALWRLVSHLSLNHLSLVNEGREALQEMLRLYDLGNPIHNRRQIDGIRAVSSSPHFARVLSEHGIGFARGTLVDLLVDEEQFAGAGVFLFSSVIERFLGMYTTLNSFTQLHARTTQRKEALKLWPPRSGRKILL